MILVDSSVWIDHLHRAEPLLGEFAVKNQLAAHPFVIEELALGRIADRAQFLGFLHDLPKFPVVSHGEFLKFVDLARLWGTGLSAVDAHLLASLRITPGAQLWTRDRKLNAAAQALAIPTVE